MRGARVGAGGAAAGTAEGAFRIAFLRRYPSRNYAQFADVIAEFLHDGREVLEASGSSQVLAAGFGVAGPVIGRSVRVTNVHWTLDAAALESQLDTRHVVLLNDLEATGYSLAWLPAADMFLLNPGNAAPRAASAARRGDGAGRIDSALGRRTVCRFSKRRRSHRFRSADRAGDRTAALYEKNQ